MGFIKKSVFIFWGSIFSIFIAKRVFASDMSPINQGDTTWLLISSALVMLMTVPGLALFYGGLSKRKDVLNTMAMSLFSYAIASMLWVIYGYSMAFGSDFLGFIGIPSKIFLKNISKEAVSDLLHQFLKLFSQPFS